jgi:ATP-dependent Clp protease adaptor protein ClpS
MGFRSVPRAGSAIGSVQNSRVTRLYGQAVANRSPTSRSGFGRIAGLPGLFRIGCMAIIPDKQDGTVLERQEQKLKPPAMYKVVLLNDDFTPMEFVVMVVQEYFNKDRETATQVMLKVHREGRGVCGVYTRDIASTKVEQVVTHARQAGHPLQCVMEEA